MNEPYFPPSLLIVLVVFVLLLGGLHLILVYWLKLGSRAWKYVDYIWVGFAALGLIGASSQVRVMMATSQSSLFQSRAEGSFTTLRWLTDSLSKNPGSVCRTFTRSEYSPPEAELKATQLEYDRACAWFGSVAAILPEHAPDPATPIVPASLPHREAPHVAALVDVFAGFDQQLAYYNESATVRQELLARSRPQFGEQLLTYVSPWLLAFAVALRITKVTGELRLES